MALFTPAIDTRNSSGPGTAPRRAVIAATEGETPGIQATTEPPSPPEKRALAIAPEERCISLSFCSGTLVSAEKLSSRDEAPKIPESRGSSTCGSRSRGETARSS
ncbi:MAG: hypothetical protein A4E49_00372 [Methanosaeta sp. PtaU1.Bin112]|nr:MAG: hypothetical protein A4E49_00372 [Methanosaeta sp. PtaU1.Bin112]